MANVQDNWDALKELIQADAVAWEAMAADAEAKHKLTLDLYERAKIEQLILMLGLYRASAEHYYQVMETLESEDGGQDTEPRSLEA